MTEIDAASVLEAMATARTVRRYRPDPIPDEDLAKILYAATRAPSGTNRQPYRFVVLRDGPVARQVKALLGESFRKGWATKSQAEGWTRGSAADPESPKARSNRAIQQYVDNFEQTPVVVLACFRRYRELHHAEGASVFPACQNLFLAARALGYGACFSGWHGAVLQELRALVGLPEGVEISLTITLGRPEGRHGPLRRLPVQELVYEESWGRGAPFVEDPPDARLSKIRSS